MNQNIMNMIVFNFFFFFFWLFIPYLTDLVVKNSHILAGIYFIIPKKRPRPNLKGFQKQI